MNVSDYLTEFLNSLNINRVFGVSGGKIEHFFQSIHKSELPIAAVIGRHEFSAVTMAAAYGNSNRKFGVVATTAGGAALNTIPALAEAYSSQIPLLAIIGQAENNRKLYGAFQETSGENGTPDLQKILAQVSRFCKVLNRAEELPLMLEEIYHLLLQKKTGPAILMVPSNIFAMNIEDPLPEYRPSPLRHTLSCSRKTLSSFGNAVIIAGRDVIKQNATGEVKTLAEKLNCPVVTTPDGKSAFDNFHFLYAGIIGIMGNPSALETVKRADTLIVAGAKLNETELFGLRENIMTKKILVLGDSPLFPGKYKHISESLAEGCRYLSINGSENKDDISEKLSFANSPDNNYVKMLKIIESEIPSESNLAIDAGVTGTYALHNLRVGCLTTVDIALGMAGMGYSFGSIIGSVIENGRKGVLIAGDGSFYMNGFEIHTAIDKKLPITFIIFNNNGHKMCSLRESLNYSEISGINDFTDTHIGKGLDNMFPDLYSYDVQNPEELEDVFKKTRTINTPILISINIDDEEIPPFLPFIKGDMTK